MRGELRSLLSVSSLYAKEPVDCLRRRIICFWGDGEKIASSPPRSFKLAASCVSVAEREREKKKHIKGSSSDAQHSWFITVRVVDIIDNHCLSCSTTGPKKPRPSNKPSCFTFILIHSVSSAPDIFHFWSISHPNSTSAAVCLAKKSMFLIQFFFFS